MAKNIIDTHKENIEFLTLDEACDFLGIKATTFYQNYSRKLTSYRNAERSEDKRRFYSKQELVDIIAEKEAKPSKLIAVSKNERRNA
ncbi:hypothetical protein [Myroides odoratus]|uniref:Helix-turn-helix domain n=1 Tax=Myroides odoratus TaxID=256 RepID=A0A378RRS3_MYROD|nr:hypothetical protein [Myroides odoratus]QQU04195.1 hypothetical protein I6I89_02595 [Myroides odoratus]STZ28400.1 Uncharacterised protein [Myroides odoratus]